MNKVDEDILLDDAGVLEDDPILIDDDNDEMIGFRNYYNRLKESKNNISYWFPKVENCGIKVPKTKIFDVPTEIAFHFAYIGDSNKQNDIIDKIYNWVKDEILPDIPFELSGLCFIKNGTFSNKFNFASCISAGNPMDITKSLININYVSLMYDAGGMTEFAIRSLIHHNASKTCCIYNGMPLRNEYRVFYDFDKNKPLYIVNYWDYDYCHETISKNKTDKIIYENMYPELAFQYAKNKDNVMEYVDKHMKNVKDLDGIWSVDILETENNELWLIDMAEGHRSAYWDINKVKGVN